MRSKIFLIVIVSIFSVLICDKVHAYYSYNNTVFDEELIQNKINSAWPDDNIDLSKYYVVCHTLASSSTTRFQCNLYDVPVDLKVSQTGSSTFGTLYTPYYNNSIYFNVSYTVQWTPPTTGTGSFKKKNYIGSDEGSIKLVIKNTYLYTNYDINFKGNIRSANLNIGNPSKFNVNFHLNGGILAPGGAAAGVSIPIVNDFTEELNSSNVNDYINALNPVKEMFVFDGWYYDNKFTNAYNPNDNITSEIDLYAKWRYESVDDFLANTNFNEYTFDTSYDYAIINRGDNSDSVYLGLPFNDYSLEIYEYNETSESYKDNSSACLTSVYNKNGIYYYDLNTLYTHDQEVLILPRSTFDEIENSDYKFLLTDNAYISYTNDLSQAEIVDSNGNHITTNLQTSFENSQTYLNETVSQENNQNKMRIFINDLKDMNSVWNEMFNYFYASLPSIIRRFLEFAFNVIMILICLVLVGWNNG